MSFSKQYYDTYQNLPEELVNVYPNLNFDNHCYLRIALDNTFEAKWDTVIDRPAYKNLSLDNTDKVLRLLKDYKTDKQLLLEHNRNSLKWRKKM